MIAVDRILNSDRPLIPGRVTSITRSAASKIRKHPARIPLGSPLPLPPGYHESHQRRRRSHSVPSKSHAHNTDLRPRRDAVGVATLSFVSSTFPEALGDPGDGGLCSYLDVCTAATHQPPPSSAALLFVFRVSSSRGPTAARFSSSSSPPRTQLRTSSRRLSPFFDRQIIRFVIRSVHLFFPPRSSQRGEFSPAFVIDPRATLSFSLSLFTRDDSLFFRGFGGCLMRSRQGLFLGCYLRRVRGSLRGLNFRGLFCCESVIALNVRLCCCFGSS